MNIDRPPRLQTKFHQQDQGLQYQNQNINAGQHMQQQYQPQVQEHRAQISDLQAPGQYYNHIPNQLQHRLSHESLLSTSQQSQTYQQSHYLMQQNPQLVSSYATDSLQQPQQNISQALKQRFANTKVFQVGRVLELISETGDQIPHTNAVITPFHSHEVPNISILWYFVILSYQAGIQDEQAPAVLVLIERLCQLAAQQNTHIFINSFTVHRLILTTVLITAKFFNDIFFANDYIASVGGVTLQNLNELEEFFIEMIDWHVYISTDEFISYENVLKEQIHLQAARDAARNHSSSPLHALLNSPLLRNMSPQAALLAQQAPISRLLNPLMQQYSITSPLHSIHQLNQSQVQQCQSLGGGRAYIQNLDYQNGPYPQSQQSSLTLHQCQQFQPQYEGYINQNNGRGMSVPLQGDYNHDIDRQQDEFELVGLVDNSLQSNRGQQSNLSFNAGHQMGQNSIFGQQNMASEQHPSKFLPSSSETMANYQLTFPMNAAQQNSVYQKSRPSHSNIDLIKELSQEEENYMERQSNSQYEGNHDQNFRQQNNQFPLQVQNEQNVPSESTIQNCLSFQDQMNTYHYALQQMPQDNSMQIVQSLAGNQNLNVFPTNNQLSLMRRHSENDVFQQYMFQNNQQQCMPSMQQVPYQSYQQPYNQLAFDAQAVQHDYTQPNRRISSDFFQPAATLQAPSHQHVPNSNASENTTSPHKSVSIQDFSPIKCIQNSFGQSLHLENGDIQQDASRSQVLEQEFSQIHANIAAQVRMQLQLARERALSTDNSVFQTQNQQNNLFAFQQSSPDGITRVRGLRDSNGMNQANFVGNAEPWVMQESQYIQSQPISPTGVQESNRLNSTEMVSQQRTEIQRDGQQQEATQQFQQLSGYLQQFPHIPSTRTAMMIDGQSMGHVNMDVMSFGNPVSGGFQAMQQQMQVGPDLSSQQNYDMASQQQQQFIVGNQNQDYTQMRQKQFGLNGVCSNSGQEQLLRMASNRSQQSQPASQFSHMSMNE